MLRWQRGDKNWELCLLAQPMQIRERSRGKHFNLKSLSETSKMNLTPALCHLAALNRECLTKGTKSGKPNITDRDKSSTKAWRQTLQSSNGFESAPEDFYRWLTICPSLNWFWWSQFKDTIIINASIIQMPRDNWSKSQVPVLGFLTQASSNPLFAAAMVIKTDIC